MHPACYARIAIHSSSSKRHGGPHVQEEFLKHLPTLKDLITGSTGVSAAVYTQLTDVETEPNGIMSYDRKVRFLYNLYSGCVKRRLVKSYDLVIVILTKSWCRRL